MLESGEMPRDYGFEQGKASIQKKNVVSLK